MALALAGHREGAAARSPPADDRAAIPNHLLLFTVVISSAFIGPLFPDQVADMIRSSRFAQHVAALLLLMLTVVWVRPDMPVVAILWSTLVVYAWYLSMTAMSAAQFMAVAGLLVVVFVASHASTGAPASAADPSGGDDDGDDGNGESGPPWRQWVEFAAAVGAVSLTVLFTAQLALSKLRSAAGGGAPAAPA